jgi:RNase P/RNase MRP subunit POP5
MKNLKPSAREKKRYLLVKGEGISRKKIEGIILEFIGVLGMAKSGLSFIKSGAERAIISVNRSSVNEIRASFVASPHKIEIIRVSGTLKSLREKGK